MSKLILIIGLTACFNSDLYSQLTAMFETAFYFEDGVGNKDTVYLKQDPSVETFGSCVTCDVIEIQEEYGEDILFTPFDSIFEVRIGHFNDFLFGSENLLIEDAYKFHKTLVMRTQKDEPFFPDCFKLGSDVIFMIQVKHLPIKVTYNPDFYGDSCNVYHYFSNTPYFDLVDCEPDEIVDCFQNPPENEFFECTNTGYFEYFFNKQHGNDHFGSFKRPALVIDGTIDTLEFMQINTGFQPLTPCFDVVSNTEKTKHESVLNKLDVYPNPANTEIVFEFSFPENLKVEVFDATGRFIISKDVQSTQSKISVNVANYPEGIYFYTTFDENNKNITSGKFIVAR